MRKILKTLTVLTIAMLTLSFSACALVSTNPQSNTGMVDSSTTTKYVTFGASTLPEYSVNDAMIEAVSRVDRASVAINMSASANSSSSASGTIVDIEHSKIDDENFIYIITCHHVIDSKGRIIVKIPDQYCGYENEDYIFAGMIGSYDYKGSKVALDDGREVDVAVFLVGGDADSDIAVLKIDLDVPAISGNKLSMDKIEKAYINEDYKVRKGETVFAIGNPTGELPGSVCSGIVSYLQRDVSLDIGNMKLMQIDATINPGNSGGGLFNLKGELIAITNSGNTSYEALNFAIPMYVESDSAIDNGFVNIVKNLVGSCTEDNYGYVTGRKEKFGMTIAQETDSKGDYVYVLSTVSGSQAQKSGLKANDVITSAKITRNNQTFVDETSIKTIADFSVLADQLQIGDILTIMVDRYVGGGIREPYIKQETITMRVNQFYFCDTGK